MRDQLTVPRNKGRETNAGLLVQTGAGVPCYGLMRFAEGASSMYEEMYESSVYNTSLLDLDHSQRPHVCLHFKCRSTSTLTASDPILRVSKRFGSYGALLLGFPRSRMAKERSFRNEMLMDKEKNAINDWIYSMSDPREIENRNML